MAHGGDVLSGDVLIILGGTGAIPNPVLPYFYCTLRLNDAAGFSCPGFS